MKNNINIDNESKQEKRPPNIKYDIELNGALKQWFVNLGEEVSEETKLSYDNLMRRISNYEVNWKDGRDVYTFSRDEIMDMFTMFGSSSATTLNVYRSILGKYIDLAIEQGYIKTNINITNNITYSDLVELVNKTRYEQKFVTREEIYDAIEVERDEIIGERIKGLLNYQDQAIILLLFEGLTVTEIADLKIEQINFNTLTVKIVRDDEEILIKIPQKLSNILELTTLKSIYQMNNGVKNRIRDLIETKDSPYFIKPIKNTRNENDLKLTPQVVQTRIAKIFENENYLNMPFMTPSSLYLSGVIDRLIAYSKKLAVDELTHKDVADFLKVRHERLNSYQTFLAYQNTQNQGNIGE